MKFKLSLQIILMAWFIAVNVAILVPSYRLLFGSVDEGVANGPQPHPPSPPPASMLVGPLDPNLDLEKQKQQVESYKQQVAAYAEQIKAYSQEVAGYTQQVAAYKIHEESRKEFNRPAIYELVVKNSLITLLGGFATTLIAYVFTNLGVGLADNFIRMKNGQPPESLKLL